MSAVATAAGEQHTPDTLRNQESTRRLDGTGRPWDKHLRLALAHAQTAPNSVPGAEAFEHGQRRQDVWRASGSTENEPRLPASDWSS